MAGRKQTQQAAAQGHDQEADAIAPVYTPLQLHFLARLEQLERLRQEYEQSPAPDAFLLQVIKKAIYATLRDCEDQGIREEARAALHGEDKGA